MLFLGSRTSCQSPCQYTLHPCHSRALHLLFLFLLHLCHEVLELGKGVTLLLQKVDFLVLREVIHVGVQCTCHYKTCCPLLSWRSIVLPPHSTYPTHCLPSFILKHSIVLTLIHHCCVTAVHRAYSLPCEWMVPHQICSTYRYVLCLSVLCILIESIPLTVVLLHNLLC